MNLFKKKTNKLSQQEIKQIGNGDAESKLIKNENKKMWITIGIAASVIMIIIVTSCIIDIYEKVYKIFGNRCICSFCGILSGEAIGPGKPDTGL